MAQMSCRRSSVDAAPPATQQSYVYAVAKFSRQSAGFTCNATPEDVVLPARIDPDYRPHPVVMGHDRHPLAPDNIENCQRVGLLERGDAGPR
jgi:hypothetical protein